MFGQPLGARDIRQALLQYRFHERVAAAHDIAHHHYVRAGLQLRRVEALYQTDTQRLELRGHGRVDITVAAGNAMPGRLRQRSDATHESAADTENVDVHAKVPGQAAAGGWANHCATASDSSKLAMVRGMDSKRGHSRVSRRMCSVTKSEATMSM